MSDSPQEIAIIGMSGRFPGAAGIAEFWRNLCDGVESISFFTDEELLAAGVDLAALSDPDYVRADGSLPNIDLFDAGFFGFSPREAETLDPQQRFMLECSWEALENAGYDPARYEGTIGVYASASTSTYRNNLYANPDFLSLVGAFQIALGNNKDHLTTQISYKLNLKGPSVAVQTACSSSLVAVSMACQSLLNYECDMALAGGVSIGVPQKTGYYYEVGGIGSPDGHCRAFDVAAKGTVGGSGVGVVVLKRLSEAIADGDHIRAVIKGTAINNDGSLKVGYTAPSVDGQSTVIAMAQAVASVEPDSIGYIEAHGTGTPLGDPIEIAALTRAFAARTGRKGFCAIGSVKTNIGHLDAAAGIAGVIKTALTLENKMVPPSLNYKEPNPNIDFSNSPFYVNTRLTPWESGPTPRRAGVSSFGIGGTNAHVVLEEPPIVGPSRKSSREEHLLVISARTGPALETATQLLLEHLEQQPQIDIADVAYTLQIGRKSFSHRRFLICRDTADAINALSSRDPKRIMTAEAGEGRGMVAFMFSGQGTQYINMGAGLYRKEPTFRKHVDDCAEMLLTQLGVDLRQVLYPGEEQFAKSESWLQQTRIAQPGLFVIEYALAKWWMTLGIQPAAMIGHSIGEYVAACLSGVMSLEDALSLVAKRGQLMQQLPSGAMLAVPLSEPELLQFLNGKLSLAAVNGAKLCVVSGAEEAVVEMEQRLSEKGLPSQRLRTSHAFHSNMMDPILDTFALELKKVAWNNPQIPYISNVSGDWIQAEAVTNPSYWVKHLRGTVRFADGLHRLLSETNQVLLEIGPGQTLSGLAKQHPDRAATRPVLWSLRHFNDPQSDERFLMSTVGQLWASGVVIDWPALYGDENRRRVPLPTYPFERQSYWVEGSAESDVAPSLQSDSRKLPNVADWFFLPSWKRGVPAELLANEAAPEEQQWLIFVDQGGLGAAVAARLRETGAIIATVKAGAQFKRITDDEYLIATGESNDYRHLIRELKSDGKFPDRVLHFWSASSGNALPEFDRAQELGFYSLVWLTQALTTGNTSATAVRIDVVSTNVQTVTGDELIWPAKATVMGPCKVIPQENLNLTCRLIDVVPSGTGAEEHLIEQLISEFAAESSDTVVAYRGNRRWVQNFEPVRLEQTETGSPLRQNGVYLITGGLGGIGLILAGHLVRNVNAKLALVGRTVLPPREDWARWLLLYEEDESTSRMIRGLQELEQLGAEVLVLNADVSNRDQMREAVDRTLEKFGALHGVIHGAGLTSSEAFQSIQEITRLTCERHFQPKAHGIVVLDEVLSRVEVDFCLLLSSISTVLGGLGFVAYAAANCFMDAYAEAQQRQSNSRWISVNWDGWQLWDDDDESLDPAELVILPREGCDAFERILSHDRVGQVIVSTGDLETRINEWVKLESLREIDGSEGSKISISHARPTMSSTYVAPRNEVEQTVAEVWQELLGIDRVGIHDNFFELGGHSLLAIQVAARLRESFQVEVPLRDLFEAPTIELLVQQIEPKRQEARQDGQQLTELLQFVERLSEDELHMLLSEKKSAAKN